MIYIIEATVGDKSHFKIGTTANCPWQRFDQLRRQNAFPVKLVGGLIGDKGDEATFHNVFKRWRIHGEWFVDFEGIRKLVSDFPISEWDKVQRDLQWGEIEFIEAFHKMTLAKFEEPDLALFIEKNKNRPEFRKKISPPI